MDGKLNLISLYYKKCPYESFGNPGGEHRRGTQEGNTGEEHRRGTQEGNPGREPRRGTLDKDLKLNICM